MQKRYFLFCFSFVYDNPGTVPTSLREAPLEITMCVFVRAAVSFDCTRLGWRGFVEVSTVASLRFRMFLPNSTVKHARWTGDSDRLNVGLLKVAQP